MYGKMFFLSEYVWFLFFYCKHFSLDTTWIFKKILLTHLCIFFLIFILNVEIFWRSILSSDAGVCSSSAIVLQISSPTEMTFVTETGLYGSLQRFCMYCVYSIYNLEKEPWEIDHCWWEISLIYFISFCL